MINWPVLDQEKSSAPCCPCSLGLPQTWEVPSWGPLQGTEQRSVERSSLNQQMSLEGRRLVVLRTFDPSSLQWSSGQLGQSCLDGSTSRQSWYQSLTNSPMVVEACRFAGWHCHSSFSTNWVLTQHLWWNKRGKYVTLCYMDSQKTKMLMSQHNTVVSSIANKHKVLDVYEDDLWHTANCKYICRLFSEPIKYKDF